MIKQFVKRFALFSAILLLLLGGMVIGVDPFFHYHKPIGPLKAVVSKGEYQCVGTVRNFDYDSILLGSSVAENYKIKPDFFKENDSLPSGNLRKFIIWTQTRLILPVSIEFPGADRYNNGVFS